MSDHVQPYNFLLMIPNDEHFLFRSVFVHFRTLRRFKSLRGVQSGGPVILGME